MGLDLHVTVQQIDALALRLSEGRDDRARRLADALRTMAGADSGVLGQKVASSQGRPYMCAGIVGGFAGTHQPGKLPEDFCVASVDGSHIDVDRHLPLRCYLINLGGCLLTYGSRPDATLYNRPQLYTSDEELFMAGGGPESMESAVVEGSLLGLKRAVEEIRELADLVERAPVGLPMLALVDGSLVLWGLAGRGYQPFVRDRIISEGLVPALDRLREAARTRPVAAGAYVSLPQSAEVVNSLRLYMCTRDAAECVGFCRTHRSTQAPCDTANGFVDRNLFQELLAPGERSDLFFTNSSVSRDFYGPHRVYFYYVNTGQEIGRMELPEWAALDEGLLQLTHTLVLDQCRRGLGYPAAIAEAHEQAVVTGGDRESFKQLVEDALSRNKLSVYTSEKALSKRMRWL